jgi:hypothetical protein
METETLSNLVKEYRNAPKEFQATSYWDSYENEILDTIPSIDLTQLRSGKYPILGTFGFYDEIYHYHPNMPLWQKIPLKVLHRYVIKDRKVLPYHLSASEIREMAYRHCELTAVRTVERRRLEPLRNVGSASKAATDAPRRVFGLALGWTGPPPPARERRFRNAPMVGGVC